MRKSLSSFFFLTLASGITLFAAPPVPKEAKTYANSCAQCHGTKGEGVVRPTSKVEKVTKKIKGVGAVTTFPANYYGPALNTLSEDEIIKKLTLFRKKKDFKSHPLHSLMAKKLKSINAKKSELLDRKISAYISKTFGNAK